MILFAVGRADGLKQRFHVRFWEGTRLRTIKLIEGGFCFLFFFCTFFVVAPVLVSFLRSALVVSNALIRFGSRGLAAEAEGLLCQ